MFQLPKKTGELRSAHISVRVRKSIADKIKEMAEENNLSVADVVEHLVEVAFEERDTKTEKKRKK
jgi:predicted DNA-binding ribbon-helix-helix protein